MMRWLAQFFHMRITVDNPAHVPLLGTFASFRNEVECRAAYERVFFDSEDGLMVLRDILTSNGVFSPSFPDNADRTAAALRDGYKGCALGIMHKAGASDGRLARAILTNNLSEARENDEAEQNND